MHKKRATRTATEFQLVLGLGSQERINGDQFGRPKQRPTENNHSSKDSSSSPPPVIPKVSHLGQRGRRVYGPERGRGPAYAKHDVPDHLRPRGVVQDKGNGPNLHITSGADIGLRDHPSRVPGSAASSTQHERDASMISAIQRSISPAPSTFPRADTGRLDRANLNAVENRRLSGAALDVMLIGQKVDSSSALLPTFSRLPTIADECTRSNSELPEEFESQETVREESPSLIHLEPMIVQQDCVGSGDEVDDLSRFQNIDDVDSVLRKYSAIVEERAKRMRGETPLSMDGQSAPPIPVESQSPTPLVAPTLNFTLNQPHEHNLRTSDRVTQSLQHPSGTFKADEDDFLKAMEKAEKLLGESIRSLGSPANQGDQKFTSLGPAGTIPRARTVSHQIRDKRDASNSDSGKQTGGIIDPSHGDSRMSVGMSGAQYFPLKERLCLTLPAGDDYDDEEHDSVSRGGMLVTSLQAIIQNRERKRKRVPSQTPQSSLKSDHSFAFAKFYIPENETQAKKSAFVQGIRDELLVRSTTDLRAATSSSSIVEDVKRAAEKKAAPQQDSELSDPIHNEPPGRLELTGYPVPIQATLLAAGSMSLGMSWKPAPPSFKLSLPAPKYLKDLHKSGKSSSNDTSPQGTSSLFIPTVQYHHATPYTAHLGRQASSRPLRHTLAADRIISQADNAWMQPIYIASPITEQPNIKVGGNEPRDLAQSVSFGQAQDIGGSKMALASPPLEIISTRLSTAGRTPSPSPIRRVSDRNIPMSLTDEEGITAINLGLQTHDRNTMEEKFSSQHAQSASDSGPVGQDRDHALVFFLEGSEGVAADEDIRKSSSAGSTSADHIILTQQVEARPSSQGVIVVENELLRLEDVGDKLRKEYSAAMDIGREEPDVNVDTDALSGMPNAVSKSDTPEVTALGTFLPRSGNDSTAGLSTSLDQYVEPAKFLPHARSVSHEIRCETPTEPAETAETEAFFQENQPIREQALAELESGDTLEDMRNVGYALASVGPTASVVGHSGEFAPHTLESHSSHSIGRSDPSFDMTQSNMSMFSSSSIRPSGVHHLPRELTSESDAPISGMRSVAQALIAKGYSPDNGPPMYAAIHDPDHRRKTMTVEERARYPIFTEPPLITEISDPEKMEAEIERLSGLIESADVPIPGLWRKRGSLYGRLPKYQAALDDFDRALEYDPFNSEACWLRHQLNLVFGNIQDALRDLDTITDINKQHFGAFQAKARIYQELGMIKLAVVSYSQVIKLKPQDADGYFQRACLFEAENEQVYASEDFKMVRALDPDNERAIRNLAIYSFNRQLWNDAIQALGKLIRIRPEDHEAVLLRGRANAYLGRWDEALNDMTLCIQVNPRKAEVFFHRASLLRERNPQKAIEDYSVCLLLDDGPMNTETYYQRALLYYQLEEYDYAVADLLSVLDLDPSKAQAYLKLGIIYMRFLNDYHEALRCFNKCVAINPIQLHIYLCRGDLYQHMHEKAALDGSSLQAPRKSHNMATHRRRAGAGVVSRADKRVMGEFAVDGVSSTMPYIELAIKEYTRAIHLVPTNHMLYLYRGKMLIRTGRMKEATDDFHAAFEINSDIAQTFLQRALVLSFQRKYKQIIKEFSDRSRLENIEDPALYMLLAKAKINCNDNEGALKDLAVALRYNKREPQIYLQRGICYVNLGDYQNAVKELSLCILLSPDFPKAYYHRGLSKLHLRDEEGVDDLGKAIELDGKYFEAYMTRASYHHLKGNNQQGVEDCNEALKIEPTSIRAYLLRGACNCKLQLFALAIGDFTRAINLDRKSHFAFYNRAVTSQLMGDDQNAIRDYSIAMLLHNDSNAYRNRGLLYWRQGDPENALLDLIAARDAFPEDGRLHGLLGLCLQKLGKINESIAAFSAAIRVSAFMTEAYLGRGNVHASQGNTYAAQKDYLRVLHMYPTCTEATVNLAYTMQAEGRPKRAYDLFTMALTIDPACKSALEGRSVVHFQRKNYFGALVDVSKAIELDPTNCEYLTNRGVIYQALGDNVSALQNYKMAIHREPKYALAHVNAANLYFHQKRWEQALKKYTETLELAPDHVHAYLNRGITSAILGDLTSALSDFDKAAELDPNLPETFFNRAHLLQLLGRYEDAEADYTRVINTTPMNPIVYERRGDARGHQSDMYGAMCDYVQALTGPTITANKSNASAALLTPFPRGDDIPRLPLPPSTPLESQPRQPRATVAFVASGA
ncbi:hypothetical protein DFS34DRAFT_633351 [Phlyctochytrium arcticum]|nr:hypothetical protein DFS34DRAFT_633351 [Phlyctochytrium arcticum]